MDLVKLVGESAQRADLTVHLSLIEASMRRALVLIKTASSVRAQLKSERCPKACFTPWPLKHHYMDYYSITNTADDMELGKKFYQLSKPDKT